MWHARINGTRKRVDRVQSLENSNNFPLAIVNSEGLHFVVFEGDNLSCESTVPEPLVAHKWHSSRSRTRGLNRSGKSVQRTILLGLVVMQLWIGVCFDWSVKLVCAVTVGAYAHFGMQQMIHEVAHRSPGIIDHSLAFFSDTLFFLCGPGFYIYYMFHHIKHHNTVGEEDDPDMAFHQLWAKIPSCFGRTVRGRIVWSALVAFFTKGLLVINFMSGRSSVLYMNTPKLPLVGSALLQIIMLGIAAWSTPGALAYVYLSSALSLGAFAHPCIVFWISQHCSNEMSDFQPTLSYKGSYWIHLLHLGALRHTEHHDNPLIPFHLMHRIRSDENDYTYTSMRLLIYRWLTHCDGSDWMDVAGQNRFVRQTVCIPFKLCE